MKETIELRYAERRLEGLLDKSLGKTICLPDGVPFVRVIETSLGSPLFLQLKTLATRPHQVHPTSWKIKRTYTKRELDEAELFLLRPMAFLNAAGEEYGTLYNDSLACQDCGAAAPRLTPLFLRTNKLSKSKHFALTISEEFLVSSVFRTLFEHEGMRGCNFEPILDPGSFDDWLNSIMTSSLQRHLMYRIESDNILHRRSIAKALLSLWPDPDLVEQVSLACEASKRGSKHEILPCGEGSSWQVPMLQGSLVEILDSTRFCGDIFGDGSDVERCPRAGEEQHVLGLNRLGEIHVGGASWDGSDISRTKQYIGCRRGLIRPAPVILISARMRRALISYGLRGYSLEVAHID